jgi:hypothetical protein
MFSTSDCVKNKIKNNTARGTEGECGGDLEQCQSWHAPHTARLPVVRDHLYHLSGRLTGLVSLNKYGKVIPINRDGQQTVFWEKERETTDGFLLNFIQ